MDIKQRTWNPVSRPLVQTLCLLALYLLLSNHAFAALENPLKGISVTSGENTDVPGMMKFWIFIGCLALVTIATLFAFTDAIFSVFGSLRQARRTNEWGEFIKNLVFILIGLGVVMFISYLMFLLLGKVPAYWSEFTSSGNP